MKKIIRFLLKTLLWGCRFITFPLFFPFFLGILCITIIVQGLLNLNEWANDRDCLWDFSFPLFVLFVFACLNFELAEEYPAMASAKLRYFWYCSDMQDKFRHLGWYCKFAKKYGLNVKVKA